MLVWIGNTLYSAFSSLGNFVLDILESTQTTGLYMAGITGLLVFRFIIHPVTGDFEMGGSHK